MSGRSETLKYEIRNKQEFQNSNDGNCSDGVKIRFWDLNISILNLFRISGFEFLILDNISEAFRAHLALKASSRLAGPIENGRFCGTAV